LPAALIDGKLKLGRCRLAGGLRLGGYDEQSLITAEEYHAKRKKIIDSI